jgi:hypothetical protein
MIGPIGDPSYSIPVSTGHLGYLRSALTIRASTITQVSRFTCSMILAAFVATGAPMSLILADPPAAMAVPALAQEPPPGPQLSDEEQEALDAKNAGTLKNEQKEALKRAEAKLRTTEKYEGKRNAQKRDNNRRRGGRR